MNAIFYKEWIKTRWYLLLALVVTVGFAGYSMLRINRVVTLKGVEHVWEVMLQRDAVFVDFPYLPEYFWLWYSLFRRCTVNV